MKLYTKKCLLGLFLLSILLTGCIEEDFTDCPTGIKVYYTYVSAGDTRSGINEKDVQRIDLFVFDSEGILRGVYVDKHPVLSPDYYMTINNLPLGEYTFITWCGVPTHYRFAPSEFVIGQTHFTDALLYLEHENEVTDGVSPIFYARKTHLVNKNKEQFIDLPLQQAYNTIHLTTEELLHSGDTYRMSIHDNNGKYDFDYSFVDDGDFTYTTQCEKDLQGQLQASLNILKLDTDRTPVLEIKNMTMGTVLYSENLVTLINESGIDFENNHTYNIHLRFGLSVSVSINGWWVVEDGQIGL